MIQFQHGYWLLNGCNDDLFDGSARCFAVSCMVPLNWSPCYGTTKIIIIIIVIIFNAHLTLLERALAVNFLSICLSVRRVDCDKTK